MNDKKTTRKNKTNLSMHWPTNTEYFTIKSLMENNPNFVEITLRVRLKKAIDEEKLVSEIGYKNNGLGRPTLVFAMNPINPIVLEKAVKDNINLKSQSTVTVMEINAVKSTFNQTPQVSTPVLKEAVKI